MDLEKNKIYNENCLTFLKKLKNNSINLAIIDPPYNLKKDKWDTFKSDEEFFKFTFKWIDLIIPKLKKNGSLYIFNTPKNSAYILQYLIKKKLFFQNWICWDKKDGMTAPKRKYANGQETILFFTKNEEHIFNYEDIRVPYESTERMKHAEKKGIIKNGKRWFPNKNGKLCREIWNFSSTRHKNKVNGKLVKQKHLTPKPLEMIERIIKASSKKNDLILDCFMGSGTTAIGSKNLGRNFIGCENNKIYYQLCLKNLKEIKNE